MRLFRSRSKERLVDELGYVTLSEACVRANQTGFFGLSQRVAPESFDGKDTNIDPRECFFGGRRIDLACVAARAEDYATRAGIHEDGSGDGADSGEGNES